MENGNQQDLSVWKDNVREGLGLKANTIVNNMHNLNLIMAILQEATFYFSLLLFLPQRSGPLL